MSTSENLPRTVVPAGITDPVERARAELKAALSAIEEKANIPRRVQKASRRGIARAKAFAKESPVGATVTVVGIAVAVGGVIWFVARSLSR